MEDEDEAEEEEEGSRGRALVSAMVSAFSCLVSSVIRTPALPFFDRDTATAAVDVVGVDEVRARTRKLVLDRYFKFVLSFVDDGTSEDAFRKLGVQLVREGFVNSFELIMEDSKLGDSDESLSSEAPSSKELLVWA